MPAHHFDNVSDAALNKANKTILLLKELRNRLYRVLSIPREFFDVDVKLDHASRQTVERKLKFFQQTAFLQAKFVQHEYKLKLIACLDGYLAALQAGMPTIIYLSARHLLELIATVAYLDDELRSAVRTDLRNWQGRALLFLTGLCKARYASSDPKIVGVLKNFGATAKMVEPIKIKTAIYQLSKREGFETVVSDYDFLSNLCHHNGSGHQLFQKAMRVSNEIKLADGNVVFAPKGGTAVTLVYPSDNALRVSTMQTANLVLSCCAWTETVLDEMPLMPFTREEEASLTRGHLRNALGYIKPKNQNERDRLVKSHSIKAGRNDPCPCGSGKKYKHCCLRYRT